MTTKEEKAIKWLKKYLRYTDYVGAAQLYLKENVLLKEKLTPSNFKARILGHWGTVPGLNLIYANMNYLVAKEKCEMLFVTGPGHGAPAILANLYAEKALNDTYKNDYPLNEKGLTNIVKEFSWPHSRFPSHVTPSVPGSILEGGELGYSLSTAFGSVMDNPNLITAVVCGDGEAESGPLAAAWHSNKFLNPKTSGAVLPIVHINGFKISNPTLYGTMSDQELEDLFKGYGYEPLIVGGANLELKMLRATDKAYKIIRAVQKKARKSKKTILKPKWPVILLRSPKGWKGVHKYHGHMVEKSFHSHGIPIGHPKNDPDALKTVEKWLKSYKVNELVDEKGTPLKEVMEFVPTGSKRIGMCKHAIGGNMHKKLKLPPASKYAVKANQGKGKYVGNMGQAAKYIRDVIKNNKKNFRMFCPDELESNKLGEIFKVTNRAYMWPIPEGAESVAADGRAMEILSEHTLQGWMQGYTLTGRQGIFVTYEAFAPIIGSMVDQYAKFLKQSFSIPWRKPVGSAVYVLSSLGWRQDHNGYSHQNPSFVSGVLQKHGKFCQIYYPPDANSLVAAYEEALNKKDHICVIVAGKRDLPQYLSMKEAREQAKQGIAIWDWVGGKKESKNPDVVMASTGDYITQEAILAVKMCKELAPELKVRYVNVSELTSLGLGDYCKNDGNCNTEVGVNKYFTPDRPVVFNYHGYVNDVEQILWPYASSDRFTIHGYKEEGSTTTPFDIKVSNGVSCYHVAMDLVREGSKHNKVIARKKDKLLKMINQKLEDHQAYICEHGDDPDEVKNLKW